MICDPLKSKYTFFFLTSTDSCNCKKNETKKLSSSNIPPNTCHIAGNEHNAPLFPPEKTDKAGSLPRPLMQKAPASAPGLSVQRDIFFSAFLFFRYMPTYTARQSDMTHKLSCRAPLPAMPARQAPGASSGRGFFSDSAKTISLSGKISLTPFPQRADSGSRRPRE